VLSLKQQRELLEEKNREKIAREAEQISLIDGQKIEISQMMSTVEKLQNQIEALQNQIEALEAIDENVQEKRKSL
jgi:predicted RNase H-like nuclease (RuvC/YqgF family)